MKNISGKKATVEVHLQPGAKRSEIVGLREGILYARVTSLPQKGQANRALVELIAQTMKIPKSAVDIIRGQSGRNKVVAIQGLTSGEVKDILDRESSCKDVIHSLRSKDGGGKGQPSLL
jgi:uncharacterized protein (TIGR00251 family)